MKLDRELQYQILRSAADQYPLEDDAFLSEADEQDIYNRKVANMLYLEEHGLLDAGLQKMMDNSFSGVGARITAAGLDFLADDGGLSAILGVVTIKLHEETLLALIGDRIEASDLPAPEKKRWTDGLRALPAESIKHLTMKLLDKGLENLPAALQLIGNAVS